MTSGWLPFYYLLCNGTLTHRCFVLIGPLTRHQQDLYFQNPIFAVASLPEVQLLRDPRRKYHKLHFLVAEIVDVSLQRASEECVGSVTGVCLEEFKEDFQDRSHGQEKAWP